jgi:HSP20 family protein
MMAPWPRSFFGGAGGSGSGLLSSQGMMSLPLDVHESEKQWEIVADVPGVGKDMLKVNVEDGVLSITAERKSKTSDDSGTTHRVERSHGLVTRSLRLPDNVDADAIKASSVDGQLVITIPKKEPTKPSKRTIDIA